MGVEEITQTEGAGDVVETGEAQTPQAEAVASEGEPAAPTVSDPLQDIMQRLREFTLTYFGPEAADRFFPAMGASTVSLAEPKMLELAAREAALDRRDNEAFLADLVKEGRIYPAEQSFYLGVMTRLKGRKIQVQEGGSTKEVDELESFKTQLKSRPVVVDYKEIAPATEVVTQISDPQQIADLASAYVEEQRGKGIQVSYTQAVNHVTKGAK